MIKMMRNNYDGLYIKIIDKTLNDFIYLSINQLVSFSI